MPLFDYLSDCGVRFEKLAPSWRSANPACPHCGAETRRVPSRVALLGSARPPEGDQSAPMSWEGTGGGNRDVITGWRRKLEKRRAFEEKHPEHATHREAIAAHEGVFERKPLTYRELADRARPTGDATKAATEASKDRVSTPPPEANR